MTTIRKFKLQSSAFTLIELLATVLITVSLSTLSYVSLNNTLVNTSATTSTDGLTAEVKSQQLLAIAGKTDGTLGGSSVSKTQAVYFALGTKYFYLFECESPAVCVYSESNATNVQKSLGAALIFSNVNLPSNTIIFQPTSGEPYNYSSTQNTLEITNQVSNAKVTLQLNSLGVLVAIYTPPPTGLSPAGTTTEGVHSITWDAIAGYTYAIRVDDQLNAWSGHCGEPTAPNSGDYCSNTLTTSSHSFDFIFGRTYKIWVHNISSNGWSDAAAVTVTVVTPPAATNTPTLTGAPTATPEPAPMVAYSFDEGSADWVYDRTGNALHSRFTGTTAPTWTGTGKNSGGLIFPVATNSYTQLTNSVLNLNNYTYGMWFKLNDSTGTQWQNIFAIGNDSSDRSPGLWINHTASDCFHIMQNAGNAGNACVGTTGDGGTLAANTWYHLEVVKSGTTQTIYLNGTAVATATVANPMQNALNPYLRIGGTYSSGFTIDDFRLYNYARSAVGVTSDKDTPVTGIVTPYTPTPTNTPVPPSTSSFTASLSSIQWGTSTVFSASWSAPTSLQSAEILITTAAHTLPSGCVTAVSMTGDAAGAVWCRIATSTSSLSPLSVTWTSPLNIATSYIAIVNVYNNATYTYAANWSCTGNTWITPAVGSWRDCGANDNVSVSAIAPTATPTNTSTPTPYPTTTPTGTPSTTSNDITVRKAYTTPSTTYVAVGNTVVYNIIVTNPSTSTYYSRGTFIDTIPTGLSNASWTCVITAAGTTQGQGPASSCGSTSGSGNLSFTLTLNKGGTASVTISAQVAAGAPATITNTASYNPNMYYQSSSQCCCLDFDCQTNWSEGNAGAESTPGNNTQSVLINTYVPTPLPTAPAPPFATSTPSPTPGSVANDIYVNKAVTTPNSGFVAKGASIQYMVDVSFPSGSTRVAFASFLDTVSGQITSPTWTCAVIAAGTPVTQGPATSCGGASGSGSINNSIILEPGGKIRFTINGTVSASATGDVSNTANVINVNLAYYTSSQYGCLDFDCQTNWSANYTGADVNTSNNSSVVATSTY